MVKLWLLFGFFISNSSAYVWKATGNGVTPHLTVPVRTVFIQIYEDDSETPVDARDLEERKSGPHEPSSVLSCPDNGPWAICPPDNFSPF